MNLGLVFALLNSPADPLSYGIDAFRILLINTGHYGLWTDIPVLIAVTAVFLWLGSYFFKRIQI